MGPGRWVAWEVRFSLSGCAFGSWGGTGDSCLLLLPIAYCHTVPSAIAYCHCLLLDCLMLLPIAIAYCYCLLPLPESTHTPNHPWRMRAAAALADAHPFTLADAEGFVGAAGGMRPVCMSNAL